MATVNVLSNGSHGSHKSLRAVLEYVEQDAKTLKDGRKLVTGIGCVPESAYSDMMITKKLYGKTDGRSYYHLDQSFSPDEKITPEQAHKIAVEFAESQFKGFEVVVATHVDAHHIHSHFVVNSVSHENGKKYHSSKNNIQELRDASDKLCQKYGFSIVEPKKATEKRMGTREYRSALKGDSWKIDLIVMIEKAMKRAKTKKEFERFMEEHGYKVTWTDSRKYITYTTPDGFKCRDNRLHERKFSKEMMNREFRIREELVGSEANRITETDRSRETDALLHDHAGELEPAPSRVETADSDDGAYGYQRTDGELLQSAGRDFPEENGMVGTDAGEFEVRDGVAGEELEDGNGETGWEVERAICFSSGEDQERIGESSSGEFGETVSPDPDPMSAYNFLSSSAYLAADLASVIDTRPKETEDNHKWIPKKERKNRQKEDRQGPTMSM